MGDSNCPNLNKPATVLPFFEHHFKRLIDSNSLYSHVKVATRFGNLQLPSILDLVLTNEELMVESFNVTSPLRRSDHAVLTFTYVCYASIQGSSSGYTRRSIDYTLLNNLTLSAQWVSYDEEGNPLVA
ncbi:unnamed protein product [Echinostoma caproni]|uniref:Endo/exonuclease/phosphatase domain-containing protein n=1 Tax=Echinostoma caproni TaxID=27848 RepID=A0A183AGQ0_9TREM|nr:unnamed protein product [Echinostoma caproni]